MDIKTDLDPIGTVAVVPGLDSLIEKMQQAWTDIKTKIGSTTSTIAIQFITKCLDDLIVYLVEHEIPGQDKKATVLDAIGKIYDTVSTGLFPIILRPFSGMIKNFVINVVLSHAIDMIVSKYNSGSWSVASASVLAAWGMPDVRKPN